MQFEYVLLSECGSLIAFSVTEVHGEGDHDVHMAWSHDEHGTVSVVTRPHCHTRWSSEPFMQLSALLNCEPRCTEFWFRFSTLRCTCTHPLHILTSALGGRGVPLSEKGIQARKESYPSCIFPIFRVKSLGPGQVMPKWE